MRVLWLTLLLLACCYLSSVSADDQTCAASPTDEETGCSAEPTNSRVTRDVDPPQFILSRATRSTKHRRRLRAHSRSRVIRSTDEEFVGTEDDDSPQQSSIPRHPYSRYEEQQAMQVQGDLRNYIRHVQASTFMPAARYCPHCRQPIPPEVSYQPHPVDPRMYLPIQTPRFQGIPLNNPSSMYVPREEFLNPQISPDEASPINYRVGDGGSETGSPGLTNQTSSFSPTKMKDSKKTSPGLSEGYLDAVPSTESTSPPLIKIDKGSITKKTKLPTVEELTKYLEKKN